MPPTATLAKCKSKSPLAIPIFSSRYFGHDAGPHSRYCLIVVVRLCLTLIVLKILHSVISPKDHLNIPVTEAVNVGVRYCQQEVEARYIRLVFAMNSAFFINLISPGKILLSISSTSTLTLDLLSSLLCRHVVATKLDSGPGWGFLPQSSRRRHTRSRLRLQQHARGVYKYVLRSILPRIRCIVALRQAKRRYKDYTPQQRRLYQEEPM